MGVKHRLSSAYHPGANLRAELGVKVAKRILRDNTGPNDPLETNKVMRALLSNRNTPNKDLGVSPAQILFGRRLKDHLPSTKEALKQNSEWILLRKACEEALSKKYGKLEEKLTDRAKDLKPLEVGDVVQVQNQTGWIGQRNSKEQEVFEEDKTSE